MSPGKPPPRRTHSDITKKVSAPLTNTRLHRLIYLLALLTTLVTAFYGYRMIQLKKEVGGWWNLALGRRETYATGEWTTQKPETTKTSQGGGRESVEDKINALAEALGMQSQDLARAIAGAVREYIPPASLSSIKEEETGRPVVEELFKEGGGAGKAVPSESSSGPGFVETVMDTIVGMDEP